MDPCTVLFFSSVKLPTANCLLRVFNEAMYMKNNVKIYATLIVHWRVAGVAPAVGRCAGTGRACSRRRRRR